MVHVAGEGSGNFGFHYQFFISSGTGHLVTWLEKVLEKCSLLQAGVHVAEEVSGMFYFYWIMFITSAAELGRPSGERALYGIDLLQT